MRVWRYENGDLGVGDSSGKRLIRVKPGQPEFDQFQKAIVEDPEVSVQSKGVAESIRPAGADNFAAMSEAEQDEVFGQEVAQKLRDGEVELSDLVQRNRQDEGRVFIHPKPLEDL